MLFIYVDVYDKKTSCWNTAKRKILTVLGSVHAQLCYQRLFNEYVDYIITSFDPGKIIEVIQHNRTTEGICFYDGSKWVSNNALPYDINKLPRPDRSHFDAHPNNYQYLALEHAAWVRTAFSCPYACEFCYRHRMNASTYFARDIADVVDEIKSINADNIYICDDNFLVNPKRLKEFVRLIKEQNIRKKYIFYGRSDFIVRHPDLMADLAEIGLYYCMVGLESIDDTSLDKYNKGSSINNNAEAIRIC